MKEAKNIQKATQFGRQEQTRNKAESQAVVRFDTIRFISFFFIGWFGRFIFP